MELFEQEENGGSPRKAGLGLVLLGFVVPALIGILAVILGS
jgi:hypothetical protein